MIPDGVRDQLIDRRYFYAKDGKGDYACGVARKAAASMLRVYGMNRLGSKGLLTSLNAYIDNESVVGFFIEQAVLHTIESRGPNIDARVCERMKTIRLKVRQMSI